MLKGMSEPDELLPRPFSAAPDEVEALLGALDRIRRTFAWKTGGLDADAMRCTLGPSTVTLGGLVKHLALVEDHYFTHQLLGRDYPQVWAPMASYENWEWTSAAKDSSQELRALWRKSVARSQAAVDEALAALKEAIKPESELSADDVQAKIDDLNAKSQEMGAAMYAAAAEQGESGDVPGAESTDGGQATDDAGDDDVVDAEVVEDDEENK